MTFADLCRLCREARERALSSVNYKRGIPKRGEYGSRRQTEILAQAIAQHVIRYGPVVVEGITIGVSPVCSAGSVIRATDNAKLGALLRRLHRATMAGFDEELIERWKQYKIRRGDIKPTEDQSEAARFSGNTFLGFD